MRPVRKQGWRLWAACLAAGPGLALAEVGNGLSLPDGAAAWPFGWQTRVGVNASTPAWRADLLEAGPGPGLKVRGASIIGDYYFARMALGSGGSGGFRASSGLLLGGGAPLWAARSPGLASTAALGRRGLGLLSSGTGADPATENNTVPYLGLGYSGVTGRGGLRFAADVGVMAQGAGAAAGFGRVFSGSQSLDELLRDLRLTPVLQLGVSYAF